MEVYWYDERNGFNKFHVKVTERSPIDLSMTLTLFIEIEPSKLGQLGLLGIFSHVAHKLTLYDLIFACKNNLVLVLVSFFLILILIILATKLSLYNSRTTSH